MQVDTQNILTVLHGIFDSTALGFITFVGWKVLRFFSLLRDFPPHRHEDDRIIYPFDYEPTEPRPMFRTKT